jgi:hypothetical protein
MLPQLILDMFARIPANTTIENKYYGVYCKLLSIVFDTVTSKYTVEPQYPLPEAFQAPSVPSVDFVVTYVIALDERPVFFLEIKPAGHVNLISTRLAADKQMRDIFRSLYELSGTPKLHGISVMGQRLAFYSMEIDGGHIVPEEVPTTANFVVDTVPANRWELDIMTETGYQEFMTIVNDVKRMVAAL